MTLTEARTLCENDSVRGGVTDVPPTTPEGSKITVLRQDEYGYWAPCLAFYLGHTATGRIRAELWDSRSERVTVSPKAAFLSKWDREAIAEATDASV